MNAAAESRSATSSPARTPEDIADLVEALRRQTKHGPARLAADLQRLHGVGTDSARASKRTGPGTGKVGYTYLHSALDDHSRLPYTEALDDEKAVTAVAFWHRAAFFAAHDITPIRRVLTDNGSCHRSRTWADALSKAGTKHKRARPYTPRTNGKVERHNGTPGPGVGPCPRLQLRARTPRCPRKFSELLQPRAAARRPGREATDQSNHRQRLPRRLRSAAGAARHCPAATDVRGHRGTNLLRRHT